MYDGWSFFTNKRLGMEEVLKQIVCQATEQLYGIKDATVQFQKTRKEFDGDITLVVFPFLKFSKKDPEKTASEIGKYLLQKNDIISSFNCVNGFLNLTINDSYWLNQFNLAF